MTQQVEHWAMCLAVLFKLCDLTVGEMCRVESPFQNRALTGHVFKTKKSLRFESCTHQCEVEAKCFSVNYKTTSGRCELNYGSDDMFPASLVEKKGYLYVHNIRKERKDPCQQLNCLHGGSCYPLPSPRCLCPAAFQGATCQNLTLPALGMENGRIYDGSLRSSTAAVGHESWRARLNGDKCWKPSNMDPNPYIKVTFTNAVNITCISTQGDPDVDCWVTSFNIKYIDGTLQEYPQTIPGNTDRNSAVVHPLKYQLRLTELHIYPNPSSRCIALRFELY